MAKDLSLYNVPDSPCYSCPFEGEEPINLAPDRLIFYYENLLSGTSQHLCHSHKRTICRGGRNIQIKLFYAIGLLNEPTNEAFNQEIEESKKH